jgi:hypothetical protein
MSVAGRHPRAHQTLAMSEAIAIIRETDKLQHLLPMLHYTCGDIR